MFSYLDSRDKTAVVAKRLKYFKNSGKKAIVILYLGFLIHTISDEYSLFHVQSHNDLKQYKSGIQAFASCHLKPNNCSAFPC